MLNIPAQPCANPFALSSNCGCFFNSELQFSALNLRHPLYSSHLSANRGLSHKSEPQSSASNSLHLSHSFASSGFMLNITAQPEANPFAFSSNCGCFFNSELQFSALKLRHPSSFSHFSANCGCRLNRQTQSTLEKSSHLSHLPANCGCSAKRHLQSTPQIHSIRHIHRIYLRIAVVLPRDLSN